jgi:hypothetical protein
MGQTDFNAVLDYVQSKLPAKPSITGKRIFMGEMGINYVASNNSGTQHEASNRAIFIKALNWGCPFVLYWEMYNNEIDATTGLPNGYWLITDQNEKTPLYNTYSSLYRMGKQWVTDYKEKNGMLPSITDYQKWALNWLSPAPTVIPQYPLGENPQDSIKVTRDNSTGLLTFIFPSLYVSEQAQLRIYSMEGKMLSMQTVKSTTINLSSYLSKGIYYIQLVSYKTNVGKKIIIR